MFIDTVPFSVREGNRIRKLAANVTLAITLDGRKDVMVICAADLKSIYLAPNEQQGYDNLQRVKEKWDEKYPNAMKIWEQNWDVFTSIFKFSSDVRKVICTTNAIESLNSTYKKLNRQRTVLPSDKALPKSLYLSILQATKKWTQPLRCWCKVYGKFAIVYGGENSTLKRFQYATRTPSLRRSP